ncbi:hypothetical protein ACQRBN_13395 [Bariatricus sp. SGI.154]|uniref:hypothetical protein n=1 Tax=Bariatricus sp. SGI.154 TaxID=3420549 RepID=UPI003D057BE1
MNEQMNMNECKMNEQIKEQEKTENIEGNMNYDYAQDSSSASIVLKERVGVGILGALAGSLIGAVCM